MNALFTTRNAALLIALGALATIAGAWFIEIVLGVKPCPLCLEQRIPYYAGIPVALLATFASQNYPRAARALLAPSFQLGSQSAALTIAGCNAMARHRPASANRRKWAPLDSNPWRCIAASFRTTVCSPPVTSCPA